MAAGVDRKKPASVNSNPKRNSTSKLPSGIVEKISAVLFVGILAWTYQAIQPPPPKKCGSPDGPPVTAPRIKLSDGRHLAYKEHGVPRDAAKFKIVFVHGLGAFRLDGGFPEELSPEIVQELGIYVVSFDRPGYGQSDPDPKRTPKSIALDIEELADRLNLGSQFYVIGFSMGGQVTWGCLKYIPHRLAGAALLAPATNYWWKGFPANLSEDVYSQLLTQDQWTLRVAHYLPWLTYWWNTQKLFPAFSLLTPYAVDTFSRPDKELVLHKLSGKVFMAEARQQGEFESVHRDFIVGFGSWELDPTDLENPFPNGEGSVHLWQGDEDTLVPVKLQRHIAKQLPWIQYHELQGAGHLFPHADRMSDRIAKTLLVGKN